MDLGLQTFDTIEEAKEYGQDFGKQEFQLVSIAGNETFLCGTDLVYEDLVWGNCDELLEMVEQGANIPTRQILVAAIQNVADVFCMDEKVNDMPKTDVFLNWEVLKDYEDKFKKFKEGPQHTTDDVSQFRDFALEYFCKIYDKDIVEVCDEY